MIVYKCLGMELQFKKNPYSNDASLLGTYHGGNDYIVVSIRKYDMSKPPFDPSYKKFYGMLVGLGTEQISCNEDTLEDAISSLETKAKEIFNKGFKNIFL